MSDSNLPEQVIFSILILLPVKSLVRFKCVSMPWLTLLSSPEFIAFHRNHVTNNTVNLSVVIRRVECQHESTEVTYVPKISLVYFNTTEKPPINLVPFSVILNRLKLVGSIHGLVCLNYKESGKIILGNPVLNQWKCIPDSKHKFDGKPEVISFGFGYDPVNDDYKIIRIVCLKVASFKQLSRVEAEVYSSNLDSWKGVHVTFPFRLDNTGTTNNLIVYGKPYWIGLISRSEDERTSKPSYFNMRTSFIWYDVSNEVFKCIQWPEFRRSEAMCAVECQGSLAFFVTYRKKELKEYNIDIMVFDEDQACWRLKCTKGHVQSECKPCKYLCSKSRVPFGINQEGKMFVEDPITRGPREFSFSEVWSCTMKAFGYSESLVCLKGWSTWSSCWKLEHSPSLRRILNLPFRI